MSRNHYEILGVPRDVDEQTIKAAYHRLAREHHPDKAKPGSDKEAQQLQFDLISTAYNTLKDPAKRAAYDKQLARAAEASASGRKPDATASQPAATGSKTDKMRSGASSDRDKGRIAVGKRAALKGMQHFQSGEYLKAAECFESAVTNQPGEASYHAKLAHALLNGRRSFNRATEAARRAVELDPYNSEHRLILAEVYEAAGIHTKAVETYEDVLKWDPLNERARVALNSLNPKKASLLDALLNLVYRLLGLRR